jgi:hypothetical protein
MHMRTCGLVSFLLISTLGCAACRYNSEVVKGSGNVQAEQRVVEEFKRVELRGSMDVDIVVGPEQSVLVEADDNLLPIIQTNVKHDVLIIGSSRSFRSSNRVKVSIVVPDIRAVALHGSGDVAVADISGERFEALIAGSGNFRATGRVTKLVASIKGSGDLRLDKLEAGTVDVSIAGSGSATLHATEELSVDIAGSGDVRYTGEPARVSPRIAGSGRVRRAG